MPSKIAEKAPSWFTRILLPEMQEMKGKLKAIKARMDALNIRIDDLDKRLSSNVESLRNELKADLARVDSRVERLEIAQRLAILEAKVRDRER